MSPITFYDDVIRLNGREYHVKFCCDRQNMYSFSCLRPKEENARDSEQWSENKEWLSSMLNQNNQQLEAMYDEMGYMHWSNLDAWDWRIDVELYLMLYGYFYTFENAGKDSVVSYDSEEADKVKVVMEAERKEGLRSQIVDIETEEVEESLDFKLQMVELDDCILLMSEEYQSMAVYYDVMEKRVVGFHFFY